MKVLVFGNPLVKEDSLALRLIPELNKLIPNVEFIEIEPTEGLEKFGKDLIILDVVEGIDEIVIIEDFEQLGLSQVYSMHDFDLAYNLKLLKKIGKIDTIKIIGIPMDMKEDEALNQIQLIFKK